MYSHDELLDIVTAAKMAGHMEHAELIFLPDDDELLNFILQEKAKYAIAVNDAIDKHMDDSGEWPCWFDWIEDALLKEY